MIKRKFVVSGKRKRAIAKATIEEGEGRVLINHTPYQNLDFLNKLSIEEPIEITKNVLDNFKFDIDVNVRGGGSQSQIEASRLAIARALVGYTKNESLKKAFSRYDKSLLVADTRRKEAYKPGDSKARRKRQKSFR
ncbi:30S ribosomal protein S9 [Candidatus Pacearchaeota archaeon]|nr:30S ribosomal protein S9 [Candidatus Pacearchaeota archaeon]MBD3283422.1 30S ribosomal protein S9 [Candidatus Pacearchaeota archaeon]